MEEGKNSRCSRNVFDRAAIRSICKSNGIKFYIEMVIEAAVKATSIFVSLFLINAREI